MPGMGGFLKVIAALLMVGGLGLLGFGVMMWRAVGK